MATSSSHNRTSWALRSSVMLVLVAWSWPAHALNLGRLQVLSGRGESLHVEVDVVQATAAELSSLQAQVAAPTLFAQSGMVFSPALRDARVSLQSHQGLPYLLVQGHQPVQEAFLDLIVQAQWNGGKLIRNYALLLSAAPQQRTAEPVAAAQLPVTPNARPSPETPAMPAALQALVPPAPVVPAPAVNASVSTDGPVEVNTGDTASDIAVRNLPESVSLDQMLVAMAKANPNAFIEGNVNLVRAGSTLRMPSPNEAQGVSRQEARQMVMAHTRDFLAYTQRLARTPVRVDQASTSEMSGRLTSPDTSVKEAEGKPDRLTLSQATLSTAQEANIAKEQEGKDKQKELDALQKNLAELQDLATNKDTGPGVGVNLPQPEAKADDASAPTDFGSLLKKLQQDSRIMAWAAALLAAMFALAWWVRRNQKVVRSSGMAYSPSFDDMPVTANTAPTLAPESNIAATLPAGLSGLSLDLDSPPNAPVPPSVVPLVMHSPPSAPAAADTNANKLQLAQQLLQQGEKDLARALLLSVIKSDNPHVQTQALQILNTLQ